MNQLGNPPKRKGAAMDEFVIVRFPRDRQVMVDGAHTAETNQTFILETGTYLFTLGDPPDYRPASQAHTVRDTTVDRPFEVVFTPAPATAPSGGGLA